MEKDDAFQNIDEDDLAQVNGVSTKRYSKILKFWDLLQNYLGAKCNNYPLTLSKGSYEDSEKLRVNYLIDFSITFLCYKNKNKKNINLIIIYD